MSFDRETEAKISTIKFKMQKLEQELEKIKSKAHWVPWRAGFCETFWYLDLTGKICSVKVGDYANNSTYDQMEKYLYTVGNYFETEEAAWKYKLHLETEQKLKSIALRLNAGCVLDFDEGPYSIYVDMDTSRLDTVSTPTFKDVGTIYCNSKDFLETAIAEIGEQELIDYIKES